MGLTLGCATPDAARREAEELGAWDGHRAADPVDPGTDSTGAAEPGPLAGDEVALAAWRPLLDAGALQRGEPYLAATARPPVARVSAATAQRLGVSPGQVVTVTAAGGTLQRPLEVAQVCDDVVVLTDHVVRDLGVTAATAAVPRVSVRRADGSQTTTADSPGGSV
jgi:NADH-quinone oxidoreductase subunit G